MLHDTNAPRPVSRRRSLGLLASALGGAALIDVPRHATAEEERILPGRIYASVGHRTREGTAYNGIIALKPNEGGWSRVIAEDFSGARISPDGRRIAFSKIEGPGKVASYIEEFRRDVGPVRIAGRATYLFWSGDGNSLIAAEISGAGADLKTETWRLSADGSGRARLPIAETDLVQDWSADGAWLLTASARHLGDAPAKDPAPRRPLYVMRIDGAEERLIVPGDEARDGKGRSRWIGAIRPRFSPDGRQVAYCQGRADGPLGVWLVGRDGANRRRIYEGDAEHMPNSLAWSPDGRYVAVGIWERIEGERQPVPRHVEVIDLEGKPVRTLDVVPLPQALFVVDWRNEPSA